MALTLDREMALTRADFLRTLPAAAAAALTGPEHETPPALSITGEKIVIGAGRRRVEIRFTEAGERKLGALRLPVARLRFNFLGFSDAQAARFLARFDTHYRRGGG